MRFFAARSIYLLAFAMAFPSCICAQTASPSQPAAVVTHDDLPPSAVLTETVAPFEKTRADLGNWSDIELEAFHSTTERAKTECHRLEQQPHEAEEALAMARLCALAREWDSTYSAARWYTRKSAPVGEAQHLAMGFALMLQADLNLQAIARAVDELRELKSRMPYTAEVDAIFTYTISASEIMQPEHALDAARLRWPDLLSAIQGSTGATPPMNPGTAAEEAWHTLALLHVADLAEEEATKKAALLSALDAWPAPQSATDRYAEQQGRMRYAWLGRELPPIRVARNSYPSTLKAAAKPNAYRLLVVEQDSAVDAPTLAHAVDGLRSHLAPKEDAVVVFVTAPGNNAAAKSGAEGKDGIHARWTEDDLFGTFGFTNGPLFVITDPQQRIVYLGQGTAAWLNPQQQAEVLLGRLESH